MLNTCADSKVANFTLELNKRSLTNRSKKLSWILA